MIINTPSYKIICALTAILAIILVIYFLSEKAMTIHRERKEQCTPICQVAYGEWYKCLDECMHFIKSTGTVPTPPSQ